MLFLNYFTPGDSNYSLISVIVNTFGLFADKAMFEINLSNIQKLANFCLVKQNSKEKIIDIAEIFLSLKTKLKKKLNM